MDADRFDALTRALPCAGSRRRTLAAILGGALGLLGLTRSEPAGVDAAKSCKGLKGKKKKKCLKKAKKSACRKDADCADKTQSCVSGQCKAVCGRRCAPDCGGCFIRYENDGSRNRHCGDTPLTPGTLAECATDDDCPLTDPFCFAFAAPSCTAAKCGLCASELPPCTEPQCQTDGDCPDKAQSCQAGQCKPVCLDEACAANCNICAVEYLTSGDRAKACGEQFFPTDLEATCATAADCEEDDDCLRTSESSCTQDKCGLCGFLSTCA
jgi:hypothetical protein